MCEHILRLIDLELDRLERARDILTSSEVAFEEPMETPAPAPIAAAAPALTVAEAGVAVLPARQRKPPVKRAQPKIVKEAPSPLALSGPIPAHPVFVSAATVRAQTSKPERPAEPTLPAGGDGTLDSLLREFARTSQGRRFPSIS